MRSQARGQATRIRMLALREAAGLSERIGELVRRGGETPELLIKAAAAELAGELLPDDPEPAPEPAAAVNGNGAVPRIAEDVFVGSVELEVGPLSDFSQLVGFEDAAGGDRRHARDLGDAGSRRAGRPWRCGSRSRWSCCASSRSARRSSSRCATCAPTGSSSTSTRSRPARRPRGGNRIRGHGEGRAVSGRLRMRAMCVAVSVAAIGAGAIASPGGAGADVPNISWTELLPALPSAPQRAPNRVAHCRKASVECVRFQIERMEALQARFGCDHKGVFATTYLELTKVLFEKVKADPEYFVWPRFFFREDALFANVYFRTVRAWELGRPVPPAWRIAFETAERGEVTGAQDMLLGINAHVQNDMPFVLAQLGLRDRQGTSRKPDHDKANDALATGYEPVVREVGGRFDETMSLTNPDWLFIEDIAGLELVRVWREQVWRNAERLVNARTDAQRRQIAAEIQAYAAGWASGIAAVQVPGLRAARDEYCASRLGVPAPDFRPSCLRTYVRGQGRSESQGERRGGRAVKLAATQARHRCARAGERALPLRPRLRFGDRLYRIQCKWAAAAAAMSSIVTLLAIALHAHAVRSVDLRRCTRSTRIAAYCDELDQCYLLPIDLVAGRRAVQLRLHPLRTDSELG